MSSKLWTEEQFNCPVCLDLPSDPVTIPCGHSYCMDCIRDYWSKADAAGTYSCPQCRRAFSPKPSLARNTMLAEAVQQLRKGAALGADPRDSIRSARSAASARSASQARGGRRPAASSSAVPCDMCAGQQQRRAAVKSCLVCMSSYCEAHLKHHQSQKEMRQHELIGPTGQLAQKICTDHKYLQEFHCRPCDRFVCPGCAPATSTRATSVCPPRLSGWRSRRRPAPDSPGVISSSFLFKLKRKL
ncbi:E3 ubiquitin/ISG15 ligase TRIM25 [Merluccius polli]|uniref:E3 ubiquitin/ISG15 ligase TRIM25 n=1 Tax=Merluccius polli TaxID=89951 RepID=A0AA47P022_MERPO|nr:E3 ubiquitin/ISG15 ligase TRIM25 [Merluccius polli]